MADIFISYSSKDKEKADQLSELLASAGLSVWIDQSGIDVATSWSGEIVDAIEGCKAFIVLLSPNSILSNNVIKEVSLAAEQKKKILPLDLEPVELPRDLKYHLAGIQRAPMTNIDAIIRSLGKLGLDATSAPTIKLITETDSRKSLMILPFEDLSPTADNQWFADGIVSEMISSLSNIKALRITDTQTTKEYKDYKGHLTTFAKEMGIRYFVQGDVRKFGDQIKISARLLDIETGDYLWQESHKGKFDDIFEIQEAVAEKVVAGLHLTITKKELSLLEERGTENAEAYELFLKAAEYSEYTSKEGFRHSIQLLTEAIKLDPNYARAYHNKAIVLTFLYRNYDRNPEYLIEAESLVTEAFRVKPDLWRAYYPLSNIYQLQGKINEAEEVLSEFVRKAPDDFQSHFCLALFYHYTDQYAKAIPQYEESVRLDSDKLSTLSNLAMACYMAKEEKKCADWALVAIPKFERYLKLHPDDEFKRVNYANLLFYAGQNKEAAIVARELQNVRDGFSLYNTASLFVSLGEPLEALKTFRKSLEAGYKDIHYIKEFSDDISNGIFFAPVRGTAEYEEVKVIVEKIVAEHLTEDLPGNNV